MRVTPRDSNLRHERTAMARRRREPSATRGPRMIVSFSRRCRPGLVKKPSFPLEIRFPGVAMKFQTDCSGLLHNKYGSLFRQFRASQSQRGSQNNVARVCYSERLKARRNLIFCVEMRRPGPAIRRLSDVTLYPKVRVRVFYLRNYSTDFWWH